MNRPRISCLRNSITTRPALAVLLAAALIPSTLCAQMAAPAPTAPADQTPPPTNQPPIPVTTTPAPETANETVVLSPFEVNASQAQGYFTPNTVAGTRLATNIGDVPSEVTVIDKQQLENTNSQNINDVMMYEAGTQGSHTYTPVTGFSETTRIDDALAGSNDTTTAISGPNSLSTRVNGLGTPDNEVDDFWGIYRIPFDTYNVQSIEIDRGPNSLMFGSGSASGIVNASSSQAQIDRLSGDVSLQASSFGGYRETADLNIPLIRNHAALYLAQEYTSVGMQRKPASDLTRRQYAAITIDPFKSHKTKITASAEFYSNYGNEENSLLPEDLVTPWLAAGEPEINPTTGYITDLATGKMPGPYVSSTTSPNYVKGEVTGTAGMTSITSPQFQPGITAIITGHTVEMFANGQFLWAFQPTQTLGSNFGGTVPVQVPTTPLTASQAIVRSMFLTESAALPIPGVGAVGAPGGYASWIQPGVVNQQIYNSQTGPNMDASDYTESKAHTYHFDLQQNIISSVKWGSLDADLAFFRQEFRDLELDENNQHSNGTPAANALYVDTNAYLMNGLANPYAGSLFIEDYQGDPFQHPEFNQNWRGMLTYGFDLRDKVPNWLKFLGHHRLLAEASTHDDVQQITRFNPVINGGDNSYTSELYEPYQNQNGIPGNYNLVSGINAIRTQYVSGPGSQTMTVGPALHGEPTFGSPTNFSVTTYNYYTGQWVTSALTQGSFGLSPITENVQDQKTYFWQSYFWNDRIIGSLGLNDDIVKNRSAGTIYDAIINGVDTPTPNNPGLFQYINGSFNPSLKYAVGPWNPTTVAGVYQPGTSQLAQTSLGEIGGNTYSEGFVVRPFANWSWIDAAANNGNILAGVARTLGFTFNKADNFNPPTGTFTDLLGNPLGKPQGSEKDYGLEIATPDKKLYLRMTWFNSSSENNTVGVSQTLTGRILYLDRQSGGNAIMVPWATIIVEMESGENPTSTQFGNQTLYPLTAAQYQTMSQLTGLNANYLQSGSGNPITGGYNNPEATNSTSADGYNVEVTYNPVPNWTMKLTGGHQTAQLSAVDTQAKAYVAVRMPIWTTAVAPSGTSPSGYSYQTPITNYLGAGSGSIIYLGNFWNSYGYTSNVSDTGGPNGGPSTAANYFSSVVGVPIAVEEAAQGTDVPELTPYSLNFLTNYQFVSGPLKGLGIGGAARWMSPTVEGYYGATQAAFLNASGQVAAGDITKPIYTPAELHVDAWLSYAFKFPWDNGKVKCTVQLNCTDLTSNGWIQPIQFNLDGTPDTYRIIPPRQWAPTTRFSF